MATGDAKQAIYAKYEVYPRFSYLCISHLIQYNESIWKLLKYSTPDALDQPNLSYDEKAAMIYKGQEDATLSRVFLDIGQPDVWVKETAIIRISPWGIRPETYYYGKLLMSLEAYSHNKINHLNNYQTRIDTIMHEFLKTFNGAEIGGIGRLFFNMMEDLSDKIANTGQIPFKGKQLFMSNQAM